MRRSCIVLCLCAAGLSGQNTGMADPEALNTIYQAWRKTEAGEKAGEVVTAPLVTIGGLTTAGIDAGGWAVANLTNGEVRSQVQGLPSGSGWELWFIDNQAGASNSTLPEAADLALRIGAYERKGPMHELAAKLSSEQLKGFTIDRAVVVRADKRPEAGVALTGAPTLFERLRRRETAIADTATLIARGRAVFRGEKFGGNGRTCGTCHVERNNFTLDSRFISTLPGDDPLFVAENMPALGSGLENSSLLRRFGLVRANPDGFEGGKFTLRAVPSLLALANSIVAPDPFFGTDFTTNANHPNPPERLGWSNDAPPVRDFALGAIVQHLPKSLNRAAGADFRVPGDDELDALAAYQLALGRYEDFDLKKLKLSTPVGARGQTLYTDTGTIGEFGHKNCNACHYNGGGTVAYAFNPEVPGFSPVLDALPRGFNAATGTNANDIPLAITLGLPRDGGFGTTPLPTSGFGNFGEVAPGVVVPLEEFATTTLVESADTAPFFHNHASATLEEAVAFYGTPAYAESLLSIGGPGGPIPVKISSNPNDPEVQAISAFLRALNALENIRSAMSLARRGQAAASVEDARDLSSLGVGEARDAWRVLSEGAMADVREDAVIRARAALSRAIDQLDTASRSPSRALLEGALENLRSARNSLAVTDTLPESYRK